MYTGYNATQNAHLAALLDTNHTSNGHVDLAETQELSAQVAAERQDTSRHPRLMYPDKLQLAVTLAIFYCHDI